MANTNDEATRLAVRKLDAAVFGLYTGATAAMMGGNKALAVELCKGLQRLKGAVEFLEGKRS